MLLNFLVMAILQVLPPPGFVEIQWRDYDIGLREAVQKQRPMVLYFSAKWNGPAKEFEFTTLRDTENKRILNQRFIPVRFDIDSEEGKRMCSKLGVQGIPTVLVVSPDGTVDFSLFGRQCSQKLNETLKKALEPAVEIQWREYNAALREATEKQRPIFIYFGASWNGPCKEFEKNRLETPATARFLNEHFVAVRYDINSDRVNDTRMVALLGVQRFPTVLIASPDHKILYTLEGQKCTEELRQTLRKALEPASGK